MPVSGADFDFSPTSPVMGETVTFVGTVTAGTEPVQYAWDFGDGAQDAGASVEHAYGEDGVYTVVMTATNCGGTGTDTRTREITVRPFSIYLPLVLRNF